MADTEPSSADPPDLYLPKPFGLANVLRGTALLSGFLALTLPLMPLQWALLKLAPERARRFPHWYHRRLCRLLGLRLHIEGEVAGDRPVLLVSNHVSWLDIPVLSAVAPVSFIAKSEVGSWPFVSWLARLQRTVFVNRQRRSDVGRVSTEMSRRLASGDTLILFAEGTSSDGNQVLPFRSALLAPAFGGADHAPAGCDAPGPAVQTLAIAYTHLHGVPLGRADRKLIGWYGDMGIGDHAWALLKAGPIDVRIVIGAPIELAAFEDRKALAQLTESIIRADISRILRGRQPE